jgi:hypothetical protein
MRLLFRFFDTFYRPFIDKEGIGYKFSKSSEEIIKELKNIIKDRENFIIKLQKNLKTEDTDSYNLREERSILYQTIRGLKEENKILRNKYIKFEIMDI